MYYYVLQWNWDNNDNFHHEQFYSYTDVVNRIKELYASNRNVKFSFYRVECESINVPPSFWSS